MPSFTLISSLQNPRIKRALKLHSSRGRRSQQRIIVFGRREITRAIATGITFEEFFVCHDAALPTADDIEIVNPDVMSKLANELGVPSTEAQYFVTSPDVFAKLAYGDRREGVVGVAAMPQRSLDSIEVPTKSLIVVLQAIEKPGNVGAIFRSADACGAAAVLLADPLTDPFHPNAIRASTGTVFSLPTASGSTAEIQVWLASRAFRVYSAMLEGAIDFFEVDFRQTTAIVLGNEANGLTSDWAAGSCQPVKLPMQGVADSLNVSVTAAAMLYEAVRQRRLA